MTIEERQRDYSLFLQTPLAANAQLPAFQLRIDSDSPFALREIGFTGQGGSTPQSMAIKFQDNLGRFLEQDYIPSFGEAPNSGGALTGYTGGLPILTPITPQIIYPPNATIVVYVENTNPSQSLTAGRMIFRGVSMHPRGTILNGWAYPQYFREIPFAYVTTVTVTAGQQLQNNILNILPDADFVLRAVLAIPTNSSGSAIQTAFGSDYLVQLKDQNGKYYQTGSFSAAGTPPSPLTKGGVFIDSICGHLAPYAPGVICPELYLQRNSTLYYDVQNPTAGTKQLQFRWIGSKIFMSNTPC